MIDRIMRREGLVRDTRYKLGPLGPAEVYVTKSCGEVVCVVREEEFERGVVGVSVCERWSWYA